MWVWVYMWAAVAVAVDVVYVWRICVYACVHVHVHVCVCVSCRPTLAGDRLTSLPLVNRIATRAFTGINPRLCHFTSSFLVAATMLNKDQARPSGSRLSASMTKRISILSESHICRASAIIHRSTLEKSGDTWHEHCVTPLASARQYC